MCTGQWLLFQWVEGGISVKLTIHYLAKVKRIGFHSWNQPAAWTALYMVKCFMQYFCWTKRLKRIYNYCRPESWSSSWINESLKMQWTSVFGISSNKSIKHHWEVNGLNLGGAWYASESFFLSSIWISTIKWYKSIHFHFYVDVKLGLVWGPMMDCW